MAFVLEIQNLGDRSFLPDGHVRRARREQQGPRDPSPSMRDRQRPQTRKYYM